jgi:hypothetical protein
MKSAVAYHGLLQMVIAHSGPGFTVRVIDPCENRYVLLTSPASTLEEVEQLGIAAIA